ncbi:MAG TPA: hypothetical protein VKB95_10900 [Chitinophagaceae bacterium]|nr:hypothetical protein [Chitinophagaceae bacterium]
MEVHAHTHTVDLDSHRGRKKWTHYFWEFLMLFLAVFCGFLAENFREHGAEQRREKQFMKSMVEDLKQDITEINLKSDNIYWAIAFQDSVLNFLFSEKLSDSTIKGIYTLTPGANVSIPIIIQQRTAEQLKNSGGLRLIQNKAVTDSLANYWYSCELLQNTLLVNYEADQKIAKDLAMSLIDYDYYQDRNPYSFPTLLKNHQLRLISNDPALLKKLGNRLVNMRHQLSGPFRLSLEKIKSQAINLITLINKEYHLK